MSKLTGDLSFDPTEFERLTRSDQRAKLIEVSDIDIDLLDHNARHKALYAERKVAHADALRLEGHHKELGETPEGTPSKEVSVADLSKAHALAVKKRQRARHLAEAVERGKEFVRKAHNAVRAATEEREKCERLLEEAFSAAEKIPTGTDEMPSDGNLGNPEAIQAKIATAEAVNAEVRARWDREEAKSDAEGAREAWEKLDAQMKALEEEKAKALRGAKFPLKGLGFTDEDLTYNGHAFETLATSEQIRVATSIAMALNPRICLVIIHHGNDLDSSSWSVVREMAKKHRFQIVGEFVDETGELGIVIEDGCVVSE